MNRTAVTLAPTAPTAPAAAPATPQAPRRVRSVYEQGWYAGVYLFVIFSALVPEALFVMAPWSAGGASVEATSIVIGAFYALAGISLLIGWRAGRVPFSVIWHSVNPWLRVGLATLCWTPLFLLFVLGMARGIDDEEEEFREFMRVRDPDNPGCDTLGRAM